MTCDGIKGLMKNGFSLQEAMEILDDDGHHAVFEEIRGRLENGGNASLFFHRYCPRAYAAYFSGFIRYLPFAESLELCAVICEKEDAGKRKIVRGMVYPVMLMLGMSAGIAVFNMVIMPRMLGLMSGFHMDTGGYETVRNVIWAGSALIMLGSTAGLLAALYALDRRHIVSTYRLIASCFPDSLLIRYASADFARFFLECVRTGTSTNASMQILKEMEMKPLTAFIAAQMDESLNRGEGFEKAVDSPYLEKTLIRFFRTAMYSSDCERMLAAYLQTSDLRTDSDIRKFSVIVQLFCYAAVGLVLIFVYQILMMPMSMLQQI